MFVIELVGLQEVVKLAITSGDLPPGAPLCLETSSVGNCRASPGGRPITNRTQPQDDQQPTRTKRLGTDRSCFSRFDTVMRECRVLFAGTRGFMERSLVQRRVTPAHSARLENLLPLTPDVLAEVRAIAYRACSDARQICLTANQARQRAALQRKRAAALRRELAAVDNQA